MIELWGGFEPTVRRVGDTYSDQLELTGHAERPDDLDRVARLGFVALRYPVLWERTSDWRWSDERLGRMRELGLRPIVGLAHHGSGPRHTNLLAPEFPAELARFAGSVAERYPWVEDWTPVNEPLTTARFSCLYGHWYPHRRDALSFARALLNQVRGVVLAMRTIREVVPNARLIQTDDLGKTHSTEGLRYQADHENERRWLTWDLLCGRRNALHDWLLELGIEEAELAWFAENPCPPDVIGVNHYLSSERFLDDRIDRYPGHLRGGNGEDVYADELAARVLGAGADGPAKLLLEAWERYRLPLAVTEAHNGCTREEQLRWLDDVWRAAEAVRRRGADIRAVTVWSLLGTFGWADLLIGGAETYEAGVFDVRAPSPRPTALAAMVERLARGRTFEHPVVAGPGWWRRPERLWYPPVGEVAPAPVRRTRPLLVIGATGTLGRAFARVCDERGLNAVVTTRERLDAADPRSVEAALQKIDPWAVVNTAGYVDVDGAERDLPACYRENTLAAETLARGAAARGIPFVTFSTDLVFDGRKDQPYVEDDRCNPLNVYGASKLAAERAVLDASARALVVRTSAFFGPWDEANFVTHALRALANGKQFVAACDLVVSPTYVPDLVQATLDLLIDDERGIWHLANEGAVTWLELAALAAEAAEVDATALSPGAATDIGWTALRPAYSALTSNRAWIMPPLDDALARYAAVAPIRQSQIPQSAKGRA